MLSPQRMLSPHRMLLPQTMWSPQRILLPQRMLSPEWMLSPHRMSSPNRMLSPHRTLLFHTGELMNSVVPRPTVLFQMNDCDQALGSSAIVVYGSTPVVSHHAPLGIDVSMARPSAIAPAAFTAPAPCTSAS